ncbi:MAG: type II secretion system protein N [Gammaproteobacteria bacterium]
MFHRLRNREQLRTHIALWMHAHGEKTLRLTVDICLVAGIAVAGWQLALTLEPYFAHPHPESSQSSSPNRPLDIRNHMNMTALVNAHLFGVPLTTTAPVASASSIKVNGILYSSLAQDAAAILTFDNQQIIAHQGTQLPDGDSVTTIKADRVILNENGQAVAVMLDIKMADLNAHFTPNQFAKSGGTDLSQLSSPAQSSGQDDYPGIAIPEANSMTRAHPSLMPTHFQSLGSLRGGQAMQHFNKLHPPVVESRPPRSF